MPIMSRSFGEIPQDISSIAITIVHELAMYYGHVEVEFSYQVFVVGLGHFYAKSSSDLISQVILALTLKQRDGIDPTQFAV